MLGAENERPIHPSLHELVGTRKTWLVKDDPLRCSRHVLIVARPCDEIRGNTVATVISSDASHASNVSGWRLSPLIRTKVFAALALEEARVSGAHDDPFRVAWAFLVALVFASDGSQALGFLDGLPQLIVLLGNDSSA